MKERINSFEKTTTCEGIDRGGEDRFGKDF
jgi:hypothetical protein